MAFIVTEKAQRPARMDGTCFYCSSKIGEAHKNDCILIQKTVKVRAVIDYEIQVPADWGKYQIEFHRNESSWCADNALEEMKAYGEAHGCLCGHIKYECLSDDGEAFLSED